MKRKRRKKNYRQLCQNIFSPNAVAIVGDSCEAGKVGHDPFKNLITCGYGGKVYPVNPKADNILGIKAYQNLREMNDNVDLAVLVVLAAQAIAIVDECHTQRIDSLIVISAGFKESGTEGAARERELHRKVKQYAMRMIGQNYRSLIDTKSSLNVSFAANMPAPGNIAFISQSGALCTSVLD